MISAQIDRSLNLAKTKDLVVTNHAETERRRGGSELKSNDLVRRALRGSRGIREVTAR